MHPLGGPRVESVHVETYVGKNFNLNRIGERVGGYTNRPGRPTHDVFDVPLTAFDPFVQKNIPASIASDASGQTLRLYVPVSKQGAIGDIGLVNGVYRSPGAPFYKEGTPVYIAPNDAAKYHAFATARPKDAYFNAWQPVDSYERPGWITGVDD